MFIKFIKKSLLFLFILTPNFLFAELKLDIVAGSSEPISIAIQKIEKSKNITDKEVAVIRNVIENDLNSTGLFRIVSHKAFPEFVKLDTMPNFESWMSIKAKSLLQIKVSLDSDNKYKLDFYLWDINGKEQIEAQTLIASKKSVRRLGHLTADSVYERLTGEVGYFDTQIVFIAETGPVDERIKRMAIMDQDGFNFRYISDEKTFVMSPHFSPNLRTIIFLSYRNDDPSVWTLDMDTGQQRRLGKFGGMNFSPRFSPDGTKIALSLVKNGITNIYEYSILDKTLKQLTFGTSIDTSPSYSPDGTKIAFNSNRSGSQQIHVLDLKTGQEQRITYGAGRYATPAWSPDGEFIAFTKIADNTFYVGIMNEQGRNEKILAGGWFMESPSWAPGSRPLVYYETEKASDGIERISHIRSVDITGQNIYEIPLPDKINGVQPTWSPLLQ